MKRLRDDPDFAASAVKLQQLREKRAQLGADLTAATDKASEAARAARDAHARALAGGQDTGAAEADFGNLKAAAAAAEEKRAALADDAPVLDRLLREQGDACRAAASSAERRLVRAAAPEYLALLQAAGAAREEAARAEAAVAEFVGSVVTAILADEFAAVGARDRVEQMLAKVRAGTW